MKCPYCTSTSSNVLDTRTSEDKNTVRRRRECASCKKRYTTYERIEMPPLTVRKRGKYYEPFNREKLINGLVRACEKRPVRVETIQELASQIENKLLSSNSLEVTSEQIGELVMDELKLIDEIAYVRFASVYRSFEDVDSFIRLISNMKKNEADPQ